MKGGTVPCAIYTRKSSEEGLEQQFNSLEAQREACEAYVLSQKSAAWQALPQRYDDGGVSGGTLERPSLQQLLGDIRAHRVKVIVVYKVDRLTRSLADFAKLVELFDAHGVSFVSVTQQFNTTTSMGRLTLNVLLSFAQFEREVTGERIRDKIAASKAKGLWMGGISPIGYRAHERTLVVEENDAQTVRTIYQRYLELGTVRGLELDLQKRGTLTPIRSGTGLGGRPYSRGHLYRILSNPVYAGRIAHKGVVHPGKHPAIIDEATWKSVQVRLASNHHEQRVRGGAAAPSLLAGLVFDGDGHPLTPTHAKKQTRRYRYYVSRDRHLDANGASDRSIRAPAHALESAVLDALCSLLGDEARIAAAFSDESAAVIQGALQIAPTLRTRLREHGQPAELVALLQALVARIIVVPDSLTVQLRRCALRGQSASDDLVITVTVPIELRRSGMAVRLVIRGPNDLLQRSSDPKLVALVDRATRWFASLTSGEVTSTIALAQRESLSTRYVARVLQLALLAPDIVAAIVRGDQPADLTTQRLMDALPLPYAWPAQRAVLGFPA